MQHLPIRQISKHENHLSVKWKDTNHNEPYLVPNYIIINTKDNTTSTLVATRNSAYGFNLSFFGETHYYDSIPCPSNGITTIKGYTLIYVPRINIHKIIADKKEHIARYTKKLENAQTTLTTYEYLNSNYPELFI